MGTYSQNVDQRTSSNTDELYHSPNSNIKIGNTFSQNTDHSEVTKAETSQKVKGVDKAYKQYKIIPERCNADSIRPRKLFGKESSESNLNIADQIKSTKYVKQTAAAPENQVETSNVCSEAENTELKQTADFFRPSTTNGDSRKKRFSFGPTENHQSNPKDNTNLRESKNNKSSDPKSKFGYSPMKSRSKVRLKNFKLAKVS